VAREFVVVRKKCSRSVLQGITGQGTSSEVKHDGLTPVQTHRLNLITQGRLCSLLHAQKIDTSYRNLWQHIK